MAYEHYRQHPARSSHRGLPVLFSTNAKGDSMPQTTAQPTPLTTAAAPAAADQPSEYALLNRIIDRASEEERSFLYDLLADAAKSPADLPEVALRHVSHALKLGMFPEGIEEFAEDFKGLTQITIDRTWLYTFLHVIFRRRLRGKKLTPDCVMELLAEEMTQFNGRISDARETLREYPEQLADEIRMAADVLRAAE